MTATQGPVQERAQRMDPLAFATQHPFAAARAQDLANAHRCLVSVRITRSDVTLFLGVVDNASIVIEPAQVS